MKTQKKTESKTTAKTNFRLVHEPKIVKGQATELEGWLGAAQECIDDYKSVATRYANASLSKTVFASKGKAVSTQHSTETIRQYVGVCVTAIKKAGSIEAVIEKLTDEYGYANISDLRKVYAGKGQRGKNDKKKQKPAKKVNTTSLSRKMKNAGIPQRYIDLTLFIIENDGK